MKLTLLLTVAVFDLGVVCLASSHSDRWSVWVQDTIEKTMTLSSPPMRLLVDNVDGHVHVTGISGSQVHMTAHRVIRAETESDAQDAKSEVRLETTEKPGTVSIYYDAPWRCEGEGRGCRGEHRHFYNVTYDIDVEVPHSARAVISTVNNGDVRINNLDGDFDVSNINGGVSMTGISGAGDAHTINGPVAVHFVKNPSAPCSFKSINGTLDIYFRAGLSADLLFKTFNGEIYSDFDVAPMASPASQVEQRGGKYIYRSNRAKGGRAGQGGPELTFDAFNGNIRLHQEQ